MRCLLWICLFIMAETAVSSAASPLSYTTLTGNWTNELGSTCSFKASADGSVTGVYNTAVGKVHAEHPIYGRWLQGRKYQETIMVSFTVMWKDTDDEKARSATTWIGQLFGDSEGNGATLYTQWLLVGEKERPDIWKNTIIRGDTFKKDQDKN